MTKQQRQPYSVCTGQFWNEQDCLFAWYVCWQPSPSLGVQFQSEASYQRIQKNGKVEAVKTDYQCTVLCLLTPYTPHHHYPRQCHYLPLLASPTPFLHQSMALSSQTLEHNFTMEINVIIKSQVHVHVAYANNMWTVWCSDVPYKNEGGKYNQKIINIKFVSITNEKATCTFHVPVQCMPFPVCTGVEGLECVTVRHTDSTKSVLCRRSHKPKTTTTKTLCYKSEVTFLLQKCALLEAATLLCTKCVSWGKNNVSL